MLEVRRTYGLTIDRREAAALDRIFAACESTALEPVDCATPYASATVPDRGRATGDDALARFYHATEQLKAALDTCYGENDSKGRAQFHRLRHVLLDDSDRVEKVIHALDYQRKKFPRRTRIGEVLRYFRRNRHRMRYADTQARHLPIGSGVVEAACKTLITQRLKRSGMQWRHSGGQAILTLRALVQSSRFDQAWALLSDTYRQEVIVPNNVVAFPRTRAA